MLVGVGLLFIWLESDSTNVVAVLSSFSLNVSWFLRARLRVLIPYLRSIQFRMLHVNPKGNRIVDYTANPERNVAIWNNVLSSVVSFVMPTWHGHLLLFVLENTLFLEGFSYEFFLENFNEARLSDRYVIMLDCYKDFQFFFI